MKLLSVHDALTAITDALDTVKSVQISMADAVAGHAKGDAQGDVMGQVLAEDIHAQLYHPPHDVSAMDGYAVRHADLDDAGLKTAGLKIIGESAAGHPFKGRIGKGEVVRIFTGAYCPEGCDTIIIQEDAIQDGTKLAINDAAVQNAAKGAYIRAKGHDFCRGDILARAGDILTPRLLSLMAAAGVTAFALRDRPLVAIMSTGDELTPPGQHPGEGQIISSNGVFLKHYLTRIGARVRDLGIIPDDAEKLDAAFRDASGADLIITSGGASVGQHDGVAKAMLAGGLAGEQTEEQTGKQTGDGTSLSFWRIAMRPGKPLIFGTIHQTPLLGLPGNPVSTGVCAMVFAATAIKALTGQDLSRDWGLPLRQGRLAHALPANDKRQDYMRASLSYDNDGMPLLTPFDRQDSGMMKLFTDADALIIRPPFAAASDKGAPVTFLAIPAGV